MKDFRKLFGKRVAELRKIKNLTQMQLAEMIDVNVRTLSNIEIGEHFMSAPKIELLKNALDVSYKELFDLDKEEEYKNLYEDVKSDLEYINQYHPDLLKIAKVLLRLLKQK